MNSFALYIHWPFCASRCPYCDFNAHVRESIDHDAWKQAYLTEISHYAEMTPGRTVTSVFFGGGTPSLMEPGTVEAALESIAKHWPVVSDVEITLEANPGSAEAEKFKAFRAAGVNRLSLGVQALHDEALSFLGRKHNAKEARAAIDLAAAHFDRYSFDLIYARPDQTPDAWRAELAEGLTMAGGHLSLYQLTIEPGTPFHARHARGEFSIPDSEDAGILYEITQDVMTEAGLPAYEISNHAVPGQESLHNLTYWRYEDYAGIGPGAHGRLTLAGKKYATRAHSAPESWLERVQKSGHGAHPFEEIGPEQQAAEALMMGLRLTEGVPLARLPDHSPDVKKLTVLEEERLLVSEDEVLRATPAGLQRLDGVLGYLL